MKFTYEQNLAINTKNKNILVSAAAGSGKTAVLVERIMKMITDEKNPIDINKILAVTFTDAAALQMKQRIYCRLQNKISQTPNENLKRQLLLLTNANISTIHSFCMNIIRKYFYVIDIDPNFKIAQENEMKLLESDILDEILEEEYKNNDQLFFITAEIYNTDKIQSDSLKNLILYIYKFSRSIPHSDLWLKNCADKFNLKGDEKIESTIWYKSLLPHIKTILNQAENLIINSIETCKSEFGPEKYIETLEDDKILIDELKNSVNNNFDLSYKIIKDKKYKRLFPYKQKQLDEIDIEKKEYIQACRNEIKKLIATLEEKIFFEDSQSLINNIKSSYPIINEITYLVNKFYKRLKIAKLKQNLLSFDDLEEFTLQILENEKHSVLSQIKNQFHEVLIDEYQDINDIQEKILDMIANRKFMVGDVKQSIYKFRNSSPEIFIQKYNEYEISDESTKINLATNFRSSNKIIDTVNFFFSHLMNRNFGAIDYTQEKLISNSNNKCEESELYLLTNENADEKTETEFICTKIKLLIKNCVCENFSDIAILIRSRKNLNMIANIFTKNNIPIDIENECDFFDLPEISTLINFLQIIDNPRNEICLVALLRSDIYCIDENELIRIRALDTQKNFYECVKKYDGLEKFKQDLKYLRSKKNSLPISKLIDEILNTTDFFYLSMLNTSGKNHQENIIKFINIALQYEKTNYKGLFNFIRYIEKIKETKINTACGKKNSNAVKIMTIHKSKGLEFPIVFVSFLGREFNMKSLNEQILLDKNLGFGNKFINPKRRTRINTIARNAIEFEMRKKNLEEEMRILYVAMTRAKNKLILTGSIKNLQKKISFPENAKCYLDWLIPIANKNNFPAKFEIINNEISHEFENQNEKFFSPQILDVNDEIKNKLEWQYPHNISVRSKISITELNQNKKPKFILNAPNFLKKNILSPTQKGIAIHNVLRYLDLNLKNDKPEIKKFISSLTKNNLLNKQEEKIIPVEKFIKFLSSDLTQKMRSANFIKRETSFVLGIENDSGEPKTLVHGIIDCFFEFEDKLYLVDYKTDKVALNKAESFAQKYRLQLEIYKMAIEKNFNRKVDFSIIYLFDINKAIYL